MNPILFGQKGRRRLVWELCGSKSNWDDFTR